MSFAKSVKGKSPTPVSDHPPYLNKFLIPQPSLPSARTLLVGVSITPDVRVLLVIFYSLTPTSSLAINSHLSLYWVEPNLSPLQQNPIVEAPPWTKSSLLPLTSVKSGLALCLSTQKTIIQVHASVWMNLLGSKQQVLENKIQYSINKVQKTNT